MSFLNLKEAGDLARKNIKKGQEEVEKYEKAISKNQEQIQGIQKEIQDLVDQINGKRARIQELQTSASELMAAKLQVAGLVAYIEQSQAAQEEE